LSTIDKILTIEISTLVKVDTVTSKEFLTLLFVARLEDMPFIAISALKKGIGGGDAIGDSEGVTDDVGVRERETPAGIAEVVDVKDLEGVLEGVGVLDGSIGLVDGVPETVGV
jgi:hypothetical protein